jgi:hypothetical protein
MLRKSSVNWTPAGEGNTNRESIVIFLGNVRRGEYESLRAKGYRIGLLQNLRDTSRSAKMSDFDVVLPCNFADGLDEIAAMIASLSHSHPVAAVLNVREAYVEMYAHLGERLGFRALPSNTADFVLSKPTMLRQLSTKLGRRYTANFAEVADPSDVYNFGEAHHYPLVLKPSRLYHSLFVTRIEGPMDVLPKVTLIHRRLNEYGDAQGIPHEHRGLQVEEYLAGSLHSIDCAIDAEGQVISTPIIDVLTGRDVGSDTFHDYARLTPSRLNNDAQVSLTKLAEVGVKALGLRSTIAHVELILTDDGPRLLEVGARPGGNRCRMLTAAYGIDLISAYANLSRGLPFSLSKRWSRPFAVVTPFPRTAGTFLGLRRIERVVALPSYRWHEVSVQPGTAVGTVLHGQRTFVTIEFASESILEVEADVQSVSEMTDLVGVRTRHLVPTTSPCLADSSLGG